MNNVDPSGMAFVNMGALIEGGNGGQGCTMSMQLAGECGRGISQNSGTVGPYWDRCAGQFVLFLASVALAILGLTVDVQEVAANAQQAIDTKQLLDVAGGFGAATGIYSDIVGIMRFGNDWLGAMGYFFDWAWFIFTSVILPNSPWWMDVIYGGEEAAHFTPVGAVVYVAAAIAGIGIAYLSLADQGCGL